MNQAFASNRSPRTTAAQRAELLRAFDRSGLSAAEFSRKHQVHYTTFCGWLQRRASAAASACLPEFVQVDLPSSPDFSTSSSALLVEIGAKVRVRISSADQVHVAAALLAQLLREEEAC